MNKKITNGLKLLIILFSICILLIIIGFYLYDKNYINSSQLSYLGSIIGGALTLGGVWWTINNNEKNRKEELILLYRPIINLETNRIILNEYNVLNIELYIRNDGRGEAENISIKSKYINNDKHNNHFISLGKSKQNCIIAHDKINLTLRLMNGPKNPIIMKYNELDKKQHKVKLTIKYDAIFNKNNTVNFLLTISKSVIVPNDQQGNKLPYKWLCEIKKTD